MTPQEQAKEFIHQRKLAYRRVLGATPSPDVEVILKDLAKFCRAHESTAHPNPHVAARLDGRREVWLRIAEHLNLPVEDLWRLYGGNKILTEPKE